MTERFIPLVKAVPLEAHKEALARVDELERRILVNRLCPECGPVEMDSEGCCSACGITVDGTFIRRVLGLQEPEGT